MTNSSQFFTNCFPNNFAFIKILQVQIYQLFPILAQFLPIVGPFLPNSCPILRNCFKNNSSQIRQIVSNCCPILGHCSPILRQFFQYSFHDIFLYLYLSYLSAYLNQCSSPLVGTKVPTLGPRSVPLQRVVPQVGT